MTPLTIDAEAAEAQLASLATGDDRQILGQLLSASAAMRRSDDVDRVLDVLVSAIPIVIRHAPVWAGWKSPGAPLSHSAFFDPTASPGGRRQNADALESALEDWAPRLGHGRAPFTVELSATGFAQLGASGSSATVFSLSGAARVGALVVSEDIEGLGLVCTMIGLLCEHASAALELISARGTGERAGAVSAMLTQLSSSHSDPEVILQTIVRKAAELLGADAAYVLLANEGGSNFRVRNAHGLTSGDFFDEDFRIDNLLPGAAIRDRRVMCVRDLQAHAEARNSRSEGLRTTICAPMFVENELVGVLMASHREVRDLSADDRRIIEALANAAAVSIVNSRLYAEREDSIRRLAEVNDLLEERSGAGERTLEFQRRLTNQILAADGLEGIVATMTASLDCQVLILDRELAVLHSCSALEDASEVEIVRAVIEEMENSSTGPAISRVAFGEGELMVAPLHLAGERSAYVVVVSEGKAFEGADLGMTEAAVTAIGLEIMRERASAEAESRLTGGLFQDLLTAENLDEGAIARRASYLGYEFSGANAVIAATAGEGSSEGRFDRRLSLETCVQRVVRRRRESATAVFERDETIYVVLSDPERISRERLEEYAAMIKQELAVSGRLKGVRIAHAGPHMGIAGVRRASEEAEYTLNVLKMLGREGVPQAFGDLGIWTLLGSVGDPDHLIRFARGVLGALIKQDEERQTQLVATLRTLVECNFHYRTAADAMFAHPNTLRYRMGRINELTGLDLTDADDRLRVELALRVLDVAPEPGADDV